MMAHDTPLLARRRTLRLLGGLTSATVLSGLAAAGLSACGRQKEGAQGRSTLRIGTQKYSQFTVLKARGTLEKRLAALGVDVRWAEFIGGPQMLEAMNVGSLEFGDVGEAPPIFALAAGTDLVYLFNDRPAPRGEAILVPHDSPLQSPAELKGRKVALNKGSNVHYLLVQAVKKAGLAWSDIQPVYLAPDAARAAFEAGVVHAWAIWDPFFAAAQTQLNARVLADGTGLADNIEFYLGRRPYVEKNPDVVRILGEELLANSQWINTHHNEAAALFSQATGLPQEVTDRVVSRHVFETRPVDATVIESQQKIADVFYDLRLIPGKLDIRQALSGH
jgi:sulfonate transport system substrate-binding protein